MRRFTARQGRDRRSVRSRMRQSYLSWRDHEAGLMTVRNSLACAVAGVILTGSFAQAAATWDGGAGGVFNWLDAANWTGDVVPTPSSTETLTFAGVVGLTNNNDFPINSQFDTITFGATAGSFVLNGNAIQLGNGTAGTKITNSSPNAQTPKRSIWGWPCSSRRPFQAEAAAWFWAATSAAQASV